MTRSGCTIPVTARPYFGSGASMPCPPAVMTPGPPPLSTPPPRAPHGELRGGEADDGQREQRDGPHRVHVGERVRRGDRAVVVRIVHHRREDVDGLHDGQIGA